MPLTQGQTINNRYRIAKQLGESSFGTLYRAWDTTANGACILEEIFDTEAGRQVFAAQAQRLFNLANPQLPKIFDAFSVPGQGLYLAMAFVEGESLQEVIDRAAGPLPQAQVLPWAQQLCDALAYLHAQQPPLVYGGLCPAAIRVTPAGSVQLVDFGPAAVFDARSQSIAMPQAAAPGFSPPEQYGKGKGKIDARSDVYALGALLYLLLTGVRLPESSLILGKDVPQPRPAHEVNPQIPPQLGAVIAQAIQIDPEQRFAGIAAFKQALLHGISSTAARQPASTGGIAPSGPVPAESIRPEKPARKGSRLGCILGAIFAVLLLVALAVGGWLAYPKIMEMLATATPTRTATLTPRPSDTATQPPTNTPTSTPVDTATPQAMETTGSPLITDDYGVPMVFIEAGSFMMGSRMKTDEMPAHSVQLDAYYIDQYEVTNARYAECVAADACQPPTEIKSATHPQYYGNPDFDNYPVIYVSWPMAKTYCEWRGGSLPTEAQWEKAARGSDERTYPWGDIQPDCTFGNFSGLPGCLADVVAVGGYEKGISPYSLYDMAGNVWEWVLDWYGERYYSDSPAQNPAGPRDGVHRVMRGGAFKMGVMAARVTTRGPNLPNKGYDYAGLRCVKLP